MDEQADNDGPEAAVEGRGGIESGPPDGIESYEQAVQRLDAIIERLDSGQAGLRETVELCREGRDLVRYCAGELDAVGADLEELKLEELAARLDPSIGGAEGASG